MRSNEELINALREAPAPWMDVAIVVAFDNRFEFIAEDHANPMYRLNALQEQGGLAIGLAGVKSSEGADRAFKAHAPRNCLGYIPFRGNKNARHRSKTRDHSLREREGSRNGSKIDQARC